MESSHCWSKSSDVCIWELNWPTIQQYYKYCSICQVHLIIVWLLVWLLVLLFVNSLFLWNSIPYAILQIKKLVVYISLSLTPLSFLTFIWFYVVLFFMSSCFFFFLECCSFCAFHCYCVYTYVWGVRLHSCPFVQPCYFDKIDINTNNLIKVCFL